MDLHTNHSIDQSRYIWDLPLRLFHWLLVASLILSYISTELSIEWLYWHIEIGIIIFSLIIFRFIWGIIGTTTSRFVNFAPTRARIRQYYTGKYFLTGHTPLGAISVFVLLLLVFFQTVTGFFSFNDEADIHGPFYSIVNSKYYEAATSLHSMLSAVLLIFICLHIIAISYYRLIKNRNIITPMLIGYSHIPRSIARINKAVDFFNVLIAVLIPAIFYVGIKTDVFGKYLANLLSR